MKAVIKYIIVAATVLLFSCRKQHFIPDPDDPNLSKFTFHQFLTGTCYINDTPYLNYWSLSNRTHPEIKKVIPDSIAFSWPLKIRGDDSLLLRKYNRITFLIPVPDNFNRKTLLSWDGKIFRGVKLVLETYDPPRILVGTGNLYFVKLKPEKYDTSEVYSSGLFNGQIDDSIFITKGRFDYITDFHVQ